MVSIKSILLQHPNYTFKSMIQCVEKYEYVSFDVFDTLIKRSVANPTDVFLMAANLIVNRQNLNIEPEILAKARRDAAAEATKKISSNREITFDDIYAAFPYEFSDVAFSYRLAELEIEQTVCHADPVMKRVYDWCKAKQKKIILISDMYLNEDFLADLLSRCGYDCYEALYVSSKWGSTKKNGNLYEEVYKKFLFTNGQAIHIGDSFKRDWLCSKKHHFSAKLIARDPMRSRFIKNFGLTKKQQDIWRMLRTVINGYEDIEWSVFYRYGFEIIGPLMYGFCNWLHNSAKNHGQQKLFFLSRDAFLLQKAYNSMYGSDALENHYLYLSTTVMRQVQTWLNSDALEVVSAFPPETYIKLDEFCKLFGVKSDLTINLCKVCGLKPDDYFLPKDFERDSRLQRIYDQIKENILKNAEDTYKKTIKYLLDQHFEGKVAVVDIGWRGSIQNYLQKLIDADNELSVSLSGYYLGFKNVAQDMGSKFSFIPASERAYELVTSFFEFPFPPAEGTLIGYEEHNGMIYPIKKKCEFDDNECDIINTVQKGALYFIECAKNEPVFNVLTDINVAYANMRRICRKPTLQEVRMFGDMSFYSYSKHQLAAPRPLIYYILHPRQFLYDLSASGWKNAFLKRLLLLPFDYYSLLKLYKKMTN